MAWNKELDKSLTKKLIGRSHPLKPAVVIGHAGLTDAVVAQVQRVLETHDLIKVRIEMDNRDEVQATAEQISQKTLAVLVNRIGKVALLYKPQEEKPAEEESPSKPPARRPRRR